MATGFDATRQAFDLPGVIIYLDGNSLGPLRCNVNRRLAKNVRAEGGQMLIGG